MKLPIPLLLYATSVGLLGYAGWQVYELMPLRTQEAKKAAHRKGAGEATDKLVVGKSTGPVSSDWFYTGDVRGGARRGNRWWWRQLRDVNFIGKLPPEPVAAEGPEAGAVPEVVEPPQVPLEEIFELVLLVYDSRDEGRGELSHVVVRYKPTADVVPPEWYVREMEGALAGRGYRPGDGVAPPMRRQANPKHRPGRGANPKPTAMPVAQGAGRPSILLQKLWVQGKDERSRPELWENYGHIRLVRVSPDAQSAFFVRKRKSGDDPTKLVDGEEEQLFKGSAGLSQDVLRALNEINGRPSSAPVARTESSPRRAVKWQDVEETRMVNGAVHISRKDQQRFSTEDDFLEKVYFDTYVSKFSKKRGIIVRNIEPKLAARFGINEQDVLLEVNGHPVKTQAAAMQFGKKEYKKGVRTFVTKWLSGGQEIERVYQLPDQ